MTLHSEGQKSKLEEYKVGSCLGLEGRGYSKNPFRLQLAILFLGFHITFPLCVLSFMRTPLVPPSDVMRTPVMADEWPTLVMS